MRQVKPGSVMFSVALLPNGVCWIHTNSLNVSRHLLFFTATSLRKWKLRYVAIDGQFGVHIYMKSLLSETASLRYISYLYIFTLSWQFNSEFISVVCTIKRPRNRFGFYRLLRKIVLSYRVYLTGNGPITLRRTRTSDFHPWWDRLSGHGTDPATPAPEATGKLCSSPDWRWIRKRTCGAILRTTVAANRRLLKWARTQGSTYANIA